MTKEDYSTWDITELFDLYDNSTLNVSSCLCIGELEDAKAYLKKANAIKYEIKRRLLQKEIEDE